MEVSKCEDKNGSKWEPKNGSVSLRMEVSKCEPKNRSEPSCHAIKMKCSSYFT